MTTTLSPVDVARPRRWAALWAGAYGALALGWTLTGSGWPFAGDEANPLLGALAPEVGAPLFAAVLLAAAVTAAVLAGPGANHLRGAGRRLLLAAGWTVAAALLVVVPDFSVLALTGYAPMLILGAPFGWPDVAHSEVFTWPLVNKVACMVGGLLLARTLLSWQRRTRGACASCGRGACPVHDQGALQRAARVAVGVAVAVPLAYAVTRYAWVLGVPLSLDAEELRELRAGGAVWAGAGLATFGVAGAGLTLGLVQRWGEVFPRWVPGLAGRRVPVLLAVVPATYVALAVIAAGLGLVGSPMGAQMLRERDPWVAIYLLWPVWGVALGVATYAYHLRRRGSCRTCGRGGQR